MLRRSTIRHPYPSSSAVQNRLQYQRQEQFRQIERVQSTNARFTVERLTRDPEISKNSTFIGIDLGTTNSCISYIDPVSKKPRIVPSPTGSWVFPTAITFDRNHQVRMFGEEARGVARVSATATLCSGKRLIGRRFGELQKVTDELSKTNTLTFDETGQISVECAGRVYNVVHITGMFLRYLKNCAEEFLNKPVEAAVVSVPAHFSPQQKVATEDAALIAGFDVLEIIDEPSAACLAYTVLRPDKQKPSDGVSKSGTGIETSLVFDLGGGTLDCALMDHDQSNGKFALAATHGDPLLGGNDWDNAIARHIATHFERKWKIDLDDQEANPGKVASDQRNIIAESERCKVHFTHSRENYRGFNRSFHFSEKYLDVLPLEVNMSYEEYLKLTAHLRERCVMTLDRLFQDAKRDPKNTDNILLVGAMTRDPPIRERLEKYFGRTPSASDMCPADYAVAIGAAIRGGMLKDVFSEEDHEKAEKVREENSPTSMKKLSVNNRVTFVRGSLQHLKDAGVFTRAWEKLTGKSAKENPNAIGHKWRGSIKGLSAADIEKYAHEIVEFESQCQRRVMLEKIESDANQTIQRASRNANKRQGMQEKGIGQLLEQIKFWQYMVRNFHDHEEQLDRATRELTSIMDSIEGLKPDFTDSSQMDEEGRIDFSRVGVSHRNGKETGGDDDGEVGEGGRRPIISTQVLDGKTPVTATPTRAAPMSQPPTEVPEVYNSSGSFDEMQSAVKDLQDSKKKGALRHWASPGDDDELVTGEKKSSSSSESDATSAEGKSEKKMEERIKRHRLQSEDAPAPKLATTIISDNPLTDPDGTGAGGGGMANSTGGIMTGLAGGGKDMEAEFNKGLKTLPKQSRILRRGKGTLSPPSAAAASASQDEQEQEQQQQQQQEENIEGEEKKQQAEKKSSSVSVSSSGASLPGSTPRALDIIEKGTAAMFEDQERSPVISENTRRRLVQDYVEERVWREPPKPSFEEGSWREVADAMNRGEVIGERASAFEQEQGQRTLEQLTEDLLEGYPCQVGENELETGRLASARVSTPLGSSSTSTSSSSSSSSTSSTSASASA